MTTQCDEPTNLQMEIFGLDREIKLVTDPTTR